MPIDPAGTTPGHVPETPSTPKLHMRCSVPGCDNMLAEEIKTEAGPSMMGHRLYRCTKCGTVKGVSTGGYCPF